MITGRTSFADLLAMLELFPFCNELFDDYFNPSLVDGLDATSTHFQRDRSSERWDEITLALNVDIPATSGFAMGMGDVISEAGSGSCYLTVVTHEYYY